jgi:ribosomal protein S18 acetylase RimI-like enzyme
MDCDHVDWAAMKTLLTEDDFDNGRTPEQLRASFAASAVTCIAYDGGQIIGTVRALSDGVCNAYIVDVWTLSAYRRRGVATAMMEHVLARLTGQHIYLFTDTAVEFYRQLGFHEQEVGMGKVVGQWLQPS